MEGLNIDNTPHCSVSDYLCSEVAAYVFSSWGQSHILDTLEFFRELKSGFIDSLASNVYSRSKWPG